MTRSNEKWRIWCKVSGGVTGHREMWAKKDGGIAEYDSAEVAKAQAKEWNTKLNHKYSTANFHYKAVPETEWDQYWRIG